MSSELSPDYQLSFDSANNDPHRLWLGGLPPRTTEYAMLQLTRQFGELTDFNFPVRKFGDWRGSTVGYCFVTYKSLQDAEKALKGLHGLNFHGYTLVARQAHPTRDELSMVQLANKEAMRLWLAEQAKLQEEELAARLLEAPSNAGANSHLPVDTSKPARTTFSTVSPLVPGLNTLSTETTTSLSTTSTQLLGAGKPSSSSTSSLKTASTAPRIDKKATIHKIELALKHLENAPIGGASLLRPSSETQRPLIPPGILAERSTSGTSSNHSGPTSKRSFSKPLPFSSRIGPGCGQRRQKIRRF